MKIGDKVVCVRADRCTGRLVVGKHYHVTEIDTSALPHYVRVIDEEGKPSFVHLDRFEVVP